MPINFSQALNAYNRALGADGLSGLEPRQPAAGSDFAAALRDAAENVVDTLHAGEAESFRAAAGKADITDVVTAVSQAEVALQTVVAVRDRVIAAYQDILRMPI